MERQPKEPVGPQDADPVTPWGNKEKPDNKEEIKDPFGDVNPSKNELAKHASDTLKEEVGPHEIKKIEPI